MARRRKKQAHIDAAESGTHPDTLFCGECGLGYHGPHKGDVHHPYRPAERPPYPYSQGLCNSRTCIRSQSRKMTEHMRSRSHKHGIEQPDSYWRKYARDEEAWTEATMRRGAPDWGLPPQEVDEDWGSKQPNPDNIAAGTPYEPVQPPIDFDAQEGGDE